MYIVECSDGFLYTGITRDLDRRWAEHTSPTEGAKYTREHKPTKLLWRESHVDQTSAEKREAQIKRWTRKKKLALASGDLALLKKL
jgi:putative endonuclease